MTINKSDGQILSYVELFFFQKPNFPHGLFYIIVSKVKNKSGLEITICDKH